MNWMTNTLVASVALCLLMAPSVAMAQDLPDVEPDVEDAEDAVDEAEDAVDEAEDAVDEEMDAEDEDERAWSVSGSLRMSVGQGTFVSPANDTEFAGEVHDGSGAFDRVGLSMGINPVYEWEDWEFEAEVGFTQSLTPGSAGAVRPYQGRIQDIEFSAGWDGYTFEDLGVTVAPSFRAELPTSRASRAQTTILSTGASVSVSKTFFGGLNLSYSLGGSRGFHQYNQPVANIAEIGEDNALYRVDGSEAIEPGRMAIAGAQLNTQWGMTHGVTGALLISEKLMGIVNYTLATGWSYPVPSDEFASDLQCDGRCAGQLAVGTIMASYTINENLSVTGGAVTQQAPKTADQRSFNFPFWNFTGAASNASALSVGIVGSY